MKLGVVVIVLLFGVIVVESKIKRQPWMKNPLSGVHKFNSSKLIGRKFTTRTLMRFLSKKPSLWKAHTILHATKLKYKKQMGAVRPTRKHQEHIARVRKLHKKNGSKNTHRREDSTLPYEFDARNQWSQCASIKIIQDQSKCQSCWAVSTASAASDRVCVATNGERQPQLSALNIMSCCSDCQTVKGDGCGSGYANKAWDFFQNDGIVTGGMYNSRVGCLPYPFAPEGSPMQNGFRAPQCSTSCQNGQNFQSSKHYGSDVVYPESVEDIQQEIYNNGPLTLYLDVYEDLYAYKSGVYYHQNGNKISGHFVRAIGWGEENGVPYWLIANSWGTQWGDNGVLKIVRGINHLDIEKFAMAGSYDYERSASS